MEGIMKEYDESNLLEKVIVSLWILQYIQFYKLEHVGYCWCFNLNLIDTYLVSSYFSDYIFKLSLLAKEFSHISNQNDLNYQKMMAIKQETGDIGERVKRFILLL